MPPNIDLNDLSFSDEQWYGFSDEQRDTVTALRRLRGNRHQSQLTERDDISSLGDTTNDQNNRHIYQLVQLPPAPTNNNPIAPQDNSPLTNNNQNSNNGNSGPTIRSTQAGNAFGRG